MLGNDKPSLPTDRPIVTRSISHEFMLQYDSSECDKDRFESILEDEVEALGQILNAVVWVQESSHGWDIRCMPANSDIDDELAKNYLQESLQRMQSELYRKLDQGQLTVEDV